MEKEDEAILWEPGLVEPGGTAQQEMSTMYPKCSTREKWLQIQPWGGEAGREEVVWGEREEGGGKEEEGDEKGGGQRAERASSCC